MEYPPDWNLKMQRLVREKEFDLGEYGKRNVAFEIAYLRYRPFTQAVLASAEIEGVHELVGWVGFYQGFPRILSQVSLDLMELRETRTDSNFFGHGIGSELVEIALMYAREQGRILYLKPERPGDGFSVEVRDREFPMSTDQIRTFYLRHGFRQITLSERFRFSRKILDAEITKELFFAGFNPDILEFGERRYSMNRNDPIALSIGTLPIRERLKLLLKHFKQESRTNSNIQPEMCVTWKVEMAAEQTKGILLAREDLKLPKFGSTVKIFHPKKEPPRSMHKTRVRI
jgi:GNAT superfamily N-acetyltransferase